MVVLHKLSDFIDCKSIATNLSPSYYYEGRCPQTGELLRLPRTPISEAIAIGLMQYLARDDLYACEGKMYGVLLVELPTGEQRVLKAFSGLLNGSSVVEGWVPPIPGRNQVALEETRTLTLLEAIKQELITLKQLPERQQYQTLSQDFEQRLQVLSDRHRRSKQQRQEKRQLCYETLIEEALTAALEQLDEESRRDGIERRQLKRMREEALQPLKQLISVADARISELKKQRKELSSQLQAQMYAAYSLTNFSGQSISLQQLMLERFLPTGTGDCCAPKLLHYAATHHLKPLAMAEFWWGQSSTNGDKIQGEFYGACIERCQPLMGFLLSGSNLHLDKTLTKKNSGVRSQNSELNSVRVVEEPSFKVTNFDYRDKEGYSDSCILTSDFFSSIIYEDEWLVVVNKPPGLLSVPGRYRDRQDSVLYRLRHLLPNGKSLTPVHRLDQETSGILVLARDMQTYRQVSEQFQQRLVRKVYEAVLSGSIIPEQGVISLPLWGDPQNRPIQQVNWQYGKPSITRFKVIATEENKTRVEFIPLTGRTHQLRVHAADSRGLGVPILGDRLYGCIAVADRLHLHARELFFEHPQLRETLHLQVTTPF
ncbi:pseudouridine synthase [Aetokthonos hydrillicola Thurmond2011]|jgi:tRNA pseudouridine32 synthase/23S rRNA pseudouridine746 synthase|uniref:RNA pseudouridylate synthase n=1 Tax=Aetokthonos hydrillicola Thurmond2011 TaxID=2712845 RepID=A0AAP5IG22_9CYAN|nr:RluA family pseudouridine synthase [Aetokthonos hydrillicola]MBO3459602.1 RluA family pseudouridine synthase [Aetokthonos hydrillicola CCALA 1050]MBW4588964.1 RluA family pseudouridine synthase [Aetokthonos hydrillicola CCALA 1050]MDR9900037.1 pseudouridine synthase [Aetokthonos hydrillicola Thurmond2011]